MAKCILNLFMISSFLIFFLDIPISFQKYAHSGWGYPSSSMLLAFCWLWKLIFMRGKGGRTKSANAVGFLDFMLVRKLFLTSLRSPSLILNLQYSSVDLLFMLISSMLLAVNASFYERVARLTKSVFPSVNLLSFFASTMVKSTFGSSSSSQEAVLLISDV